jgi:hypothetical protein
VRVAAVGWVSRRRNPPDHRGNQALNRAGKRTAFLPALPGYDKMEEISWYQSTTTPKRANTTAFFLYFGKKDSGQLLPIRLVVRYYADNWLFVTHAWAKVDGVKIDVPQQSQTILGWERDNSGGKIWEWSDTAVITAQGIEAVRRISEAKDAIVRFEGRQYYDDRTLTANQLKAMREVIAAYEKATEKAWK